MVTQGLFLPVAYRMAETCKRTLVWSPDIRQYPSLHQGVIGDGMAGVERVLDMFDHVKDIDLFVFPDCQLSGMQKYLAEQGHLVWGSRDGIELELDREYFLDVLKELKLDVPNYTVVEGLTELGKYLYDKTDKWLKVSRWRGDFETKHWRDWTSDSILLDKFAVQFGPLKESIRFLVFDPIETDLEIGGDTYNVMGRWPTYMLNGIEWKDKSYFSAVTRSELMPDQLQVVMESFAPILERYGYRNQWSMEVRVKDDKAFFIDATCRGGMPSSGSQQLLWANFPEILYYGAAGELVEPIPDAEFSIECMVTCQTGEEGWEVAHTPELGRELRMSNCGMVGECWVFPPDPHSHGELGWLVATGNTPDAVLQDIKDAADRLPDGLDANVEALAGVLKEIDTAAEEGIPFTKKKVPPPASVIED